MKATALIALIQLLPEIKDAAASFRRTEKPSRVSTPHKRFLSHQECVYVASVYQIACRHNTVFPHESVTDDQLVAYFNLLFERQLPMSQYRRVWQNFKLKKSIL